MLNEQLYYSIEAALDERFLVFSIKPDTHFDMTIALKNSIDKISPVMDQLLARFLSLKFYIIFEIKMRKILENESTIFGFHSKTHTFLLSDVIADILELCYDKITGSVDKFLRKGSGYVFDGIHDVCLHVFRYSPLAGGSYFPLPAKLKKKQCLLNHQNDDNYCLIYCLLSSIFPELSDKISVDHFMNYMNVLNFKGIEFPVDLRALSKIEKMNNLRINCFGYDDSLKTGIFPCYISKSETESVINILLIQNDLGNSHYVLIQDFNCLMRNRTNFSTGMLYCLRCLCSFTTQRLLTEHAKICANFEIAVTSMPPKGSVMKFDRFKALINYNVVIYCDFESILKPITGPANNEQKTVIENEHIACAWAYKVVCNSRPELTKPIKFYSGHDCEMKLMENLNCEYDIVEEHLSRTSNIKMTEEDEKRFRASKVCGICGEMLDWKTVDRRLKVVKHHDHFLTENNFISACHSRCNIKVQKSRRICIVFHGMRNYDAKFIIRALCRVTDTSDIHILANNMEKFVEIKTPKFVFRDSYLLMSESLDKLVKSMRSQGTEDFKHLREEYPEKESFELCLGKGD